MASASIDINTLIGNVDEFPILKDWAFFNHAGVSPLPKRAAEAMRQYTVDAETRTYLVGTWYRDVEALRVLAAKMINAHRDEIAFVKNTSEGMAIVARGIDWQWGDRIVTTDVEYPTNIYPWMDVARSNGAQLVMVPEETNERGERITPTQKILEEAAKPRTRLVSLSAVEYGSGQRHELRKIGNFCRERNIRFAVDAIQAFGVLPLDVQEMKIDFLSADGHKWMMGPEGAGVFYCAHDLIERTRPLMIGWMNVINNQDYDKYDFTLRPDAGRFECGSYNIPGLLALKASLGMLHSIGLDALKDRLRTLTDRLAAGLKSRGWHIASPRGEGVWSGLVSFYSDRYDLDKVVLTLRKEHKIEIAYRAGRLRASPHFYNTEDQIDRLLETLPPLPTP